MEVTVPAVAVNPPVVAPAAIVIEAASVSAALLSDSATVTPPLGAACDRVTVQLLLPPEPMVAGEQARAVNVVGGGVMVTDAVAELPVNDAVIVAL